MAKGVNSKGFEPTKTQQRAIDAVVTDYRNLATAKAKSIVVRDRLSGRAHKARALGVPRQVLIDTIGSTGAVGNMLRTRP